MICEAMGVFKEFVCGMKKKREMWWGIENLWLAGTCCGRS